MILLYRGKSWFSRLIEFINWRKYSHASWTFATMSGDGCLSGDLSEFESNIYTLKDNGVRHLLSVGSTHKPGTRVDLFALKQPLTRSQNETMMIFLVSQIGKPYDFRGIWSFLTRSKGQNPGKWFCSEYVYAALEAAGRPILANIEPWQVFPGLLANSTELTYLGFILTGDPAFRIYQDPVPAGFTSRKARSRS